MRPQSLEQLLSSVVTQTVIPDQIIIVDGSTNDDTQRLLEHHKFALPITYTRVSDKNRGLTKQRNVGISMLNDTSEVVLFLDDDVILENTFIEHILVPFTDADVVGCDGFITNECYWKRNQRNESTPKFSQQLDGFHLKLSTRDRFRAVLGLFPLLVQPGNIPLYGHGKSSLPPTGKQYEVDHIMGGITAYRKTIFNHIQFSTFFEGYGLYEDFDFSVRANRFGRLLTNTAAKLSHHHADSGRPHTYTFGKMVVRNGWYVWRLKHPKPGIQNTIKWHIITLLLAFFRLSNVLTTNALKRKQAWGDFCGRIVAWVELLLFKPPLPQP
jgi:GT2 family glycosyltransferase